MMEIASNDKDYKTNAKWEYLFEKKNPEDREAKPLAPRYANGAPGEVGSNSSRRGRRVWFHLQEGTGELKEGELTGCGETLFRMKIKRLQTRSDFRRKCSIADFCSCFCRLGSSPALDERCEKSEQHWRSVWPCLMAGFRVACLVIPALWVPVGLPGLAWKSFHLPCELRVVEV